MGKENSMSENTDRDSLRKEKRERKREKTKLTRELETVLIPNEFLSAFAASKEQNLRIPRLSSSEVMDDSLLSTPWRKGKETNPWSEATYDTLKAEVQTHKLCKDAGIKHVNILLVGEISAGKSSFFNSVESVFAGYVTARANSGFDVVSVTTQYRQYRVQAKDKKKKAIKFKFCDSMGLEGGEVGLSAADVGKIMDGHVNELAELKNGVQPNMPGYNAHPDDDDRIHCVAFVVNAVTVSSMNDGIIKKIKDIRREANGRNMVPIVIMTRIDEICKITEKDTSKVFRSRMVKEKVEEVSKIFGINQTQIYPVRNYSNQTDVETEIDILILTVARQIVRNSQDFLLDKLERKEVEKKNLEKKIAVMKKEKKKKRSRGGNSSDEDSDAEEEEDSSDDEEEEEEESDSDSSRRGKKAKKNKGRKSLTSYADSEYISGRGKGKSTGSKRPPDVPKAKKPPPARPSDCRKGFAEYDFDGDREDGEVDLREGEEVTEMKPDKDGWTVVKNTRGEKGKVPSNYVNWSAAKGPKRPPAPPKMTKKLLALYDYEATDETEVDLNADEKVIEVKPDDGGWTMVRREDGSEGNVPSDYLGTL